VSLLPSPTGVKNKKPPGCKRGTTRPLSFDSHKEAYTMAFSELELKRITKAVGQFMSRRRPDPAIRHKVDFGYQIRGHSLELFEIRPDWRDKTVVHHVPFAKITFVRTTNAWRLFWMRADLKWHAYPPAPYVDTVEEALSLIDEDANCCFFG